MTPDHLAAIRQKNNCWQTELLSHIAEQDAQLEAASAALAEMQQEVVLRREREEKLVAMLKRIEWSGSFYSDPEGERCPSCDGWPKVGHYRCCELAALLAPSKANAEA